MISYPACAGPAYVHSPLDLSIHRGTPRSYLFERRGVGFPIAGAKILLTSGFFDSKRRRVFCGLARVTLFLHFAGALHNKIEDDFGEIEVWVADSGLNAPTVPR